MSSLSDPLDGGGYFRQPTDPVEQPGPWWLVCDNADYHQFDENPKRRYFYVPVHLQPTHGALDPEGQGRILCPHCRKDAKRRVGDSLLIDAHARTLLERVIEQAGLSRNCGYCTRYIKATFELWQQNPDRHSPGVIAIGKALGDSPRTDLRRRSEHQQRTGHPVPDPEELVKFFRAKLPDPEDTI